MSVHRKGDRWAVRYREAGSNRSRSFDRKADAQRFDAARRRQSRAVDEHARIGARIREIDELLLDLKHRVDRVADDDDMIVIVALDRALDAWDAFTKETAR